MTIGSPSSMMTQIFVLLFSMVLISSSTIIRAQPLTLAATDNSSSDEINNEVNHAFKQMSKFCFEEVDCQKCADSFHESVTDVQGTIFEKIASTTGLTKMIQDTVTNMSLSFKDKILASCEALMKAKEKMDNPDSASTVVFTNYSGASSNQGVFLTTVYSGIPQMDELNDEMKSAMHQYGKGFMPPPPPPSSVMPQFLAARPEHHPSTAPAATTDPSAKYRDPKMYAQYIPESYRQFGTMGQGYQDQQNKYAEKYIGKDTKDASSTPKSQSHPDSMVLVSMPMDSTSSPSSPASAMGDYMKMIPVVGQFNLTQLQEQFPNLKDFNMTEMIPSYKMDGGLPSFTSYNYSSIPGMNSFPGMNPEMIEKFSELNKMSMPNASNWLPSTFTSFNMSELPSFHLPGNGSVFQLPNNMTIIPFEIPSLPLHMPNMTEAGMTSMIPMSIRNLMPNVNLPSIGDITSAFNIPMMPEDNKPFIPSSSSSSSSQFPFFNLPNMSDVIPSMDSLGVYDIGRLNPNHDAFPDLENMNLTDMASPSIGFLFVDTDGNQMMALPFIGSPSPSSADDDATAGQGLFDYKQYSDKYDPMFKQGAAMDKEVMDKVNEMMPDSINQLKESVSTASSAIGKRLKDAATGSVEDLKTAGHEMLDTIKSAYGKDVQGLYGRSSSTSSTTLPRIIQLPNQKYAKATPMSFYVETTDGKISYLEQIPMASSDGSDSSSSNAVQSMMSDAKQEAQSALESLRGVMEGYWNKFASGSCLDMTQFVAAKFEGVVDNFDMNKFLQPAEQFASDQMKSLKSFNVDKYTNSAQQFMGDAKQGIENQGKKTQDFVKSYVPQNVKDLSPDTLMHQAKSYIPSNIPSKGLMTFFGFQGPHIPPPTPKPVMVANDSPPSLLGRMIHEGVELQKKETRGYGNPLGSLGLPSQFSSGFNGFQFDPVMQSMIQPSSSGNTDMVLVAVDNDAAAQPAHSALMKACEFAKENNLFSNVNLLSIHDLFFNPKNQHGVATVSFINSNNNGVAPMAFLELSPLSPSSANSDDSATVQFDDIYRNLTQIVEGAMSDKMEKAQKVFNDLKSAAEEKLGKLQSDAKSTVDEHKINKDQMMKDFTDYVSNKLDEYKDQMNDAINSIHEQLSKKLEKVKACKDGDSDCVVHAISLYEIPSGTIPSNQEKQIVTYFKSTPDGKKIMKMVNFEAVKHDDSDLVSRLETSLFPGGASAAFSPAALAIYATIGVAMFLGWVWANLTVKPDRFMTYIEDADSPLTSAGPLITNGHQSEEQSDANYYRMQDV